MLFMVIEKFRDQNALAVYREFRAKGRQMPDGLTFVGSWVTATCAAFSSWSVTTSRCCSAGSPAGPT